MMKYLGLIAAWFVVAVVILLLLVVVAVAPFGGLTAGLLGKVFGLWLLVGLTGGAIGAVVAYYKVKGLVESIKEFANANDLDERDGGIQSYLPELKRADGGQLQKVAQEAQVQRLNKEMVDAGFAHEADYVIEGVPGLVVTAYAHSERNVHGIVSFLPSKGAWIELAGEFEDGTHLSVSGLMMPKVLDSRPALICISQPGAGVVEQLELFEKNKPSGQIVDVKGRTYKRYFEVCWWDENYWRRGRGGKTLDEIRRVAAAGAGDMGEMTEAELKQVMEAENQQWRDAWTQVPGQLIDRHLRSAGLNEENEAYYDRQVSLVAVFEGQSVDEFAEYLSQRLQNLNEQMQNKQRGEDSEATQSFKVSTFRPGADGYKLAAAADGKADGLAGAAAASMKYPDWFKEVHAGDHPMRYVIYEVSQA